MIPTQTLYAVYLGSLLLALLLQLVQLPDFLAAARPLWLPLTLSYWALTEPRVSTLLGGFLLGLAADILFGSVLGQHAAGLVMIAYAVQRLRSIFVLFPLWQATLALMPAWIGYALLMSWADSATAHSANAWLRWLPVLSTTLFWPLMYTLMERLMRREDEQEI